MYQVAYVLDGVKYNSDSQIIKNPIDEKIETKRLDKLYYKLLKIISEDASLGFVKMIKENGFLNVLILALKIDDIRTAYVLTKAAKDIEYYKKLMQDGFATLVMVALSSPICMKLVIDLENDIYPITFTGKLNEEMLVCLFRHSMYYPQNKDICMKYIKTYNYDSSFVNRPFFYLYDDIEMISKHLVKDINVRNVMYVCAIDHGSLKIINKLNKYYNQNRIIYSRLTLPILLKNTKEFSIYEENKAMIMETIVSNKWEFLPFIFKNYKLDSEDWEKFRFSIYEGNSSDIFLRTLFSSMKKNDIDFFHLYQKDRIVYCNDKSYQVFKDFDIDINFSFKRKEKFKRTITADVSNLFEFYIVNALNLIKEQLFIFYAHRNERFQEDKKFLLNMISSDEFGWNQELKEKFFEFNNFCDEFCLYMEMGDYLITEYNSYLGAHMYLPHQMLMRFLNKISRIVYNIKDDFVKNEYKSIIKKFNEHYWDNMRKVREDIGLEDLEDEEIWYLPESPSLEDLFADLYQYSMFKYKKDENSYTSHIIKTLKERGFNKIVKEVEMAFASLISSDDVLRILNMKGIKIDFDF
jgi:hypothetical protein